MHLSLLFLITFTITPSFADDVSFSGCDRTFSCGPIQDITYPFTGGDRPAYCGPPEFRLTCPDNSSYPELIANSLTYRVLQIDQGRQILKLVRLDLYNNTCPEKFINSTLNSTIFTYGPDTVDLTLIYGCPSSLLIQNMFTCNVNGVSFNDAYYFIGPVPVPVPVPNFIRCAVSLMVPILRIVGDGLTSNSKALGEVLNAGFNVNFSDPYTRQCLDCRLSGRQCGFDSNSSRPICICGHSLCTGAGSRASSPRTLSIVLPVIGAILAGICIGWLIFFCRQRRKRRAAKSTTQTLSKDLPTTLSSTALLTTPTTHFSQSIPSYPSSRSEVGKGSTYFGVQVFSYTELEQATDNFNPSKELGDGGFGTVYYGTLQDGRIVAVKRLYENNFKRVEQFMNEVEILTRLDHENLVKLYGCTSKRSRELLLVYEYIPNGTVADHLHGKRANSGLLSWSVRLKIAIETAEALAYLHASAIIHRDVKTNNILLDNSFCVKVADFGLSRLFPNDATHVSTAPQGTPGYVDPEYYRCYKLTDKSDVYSFGVVLVELISSLQAVDTNRHRHDINLANMAVSKIQNQTFNELVDQSLGFETNTSVKKMTTLVGELAFRCLQEEKDLRPSMKEVVDILKGIQNEESDSQKVGVLEILVDDGAPLKGKDPSLSPDSVADKWISSSTHNSSD